MESYFTIHGSRWFVFEIRAMHHFISSIKINPCLPINIYFTLVFKIKSLIQYNSSILFPPHPLIFIDFCILLCARLLCVNGFSDQAFECSSKIMPFPFSILINLFIKIHNTRVITQNMRNALITIVIEPPCIFI